MLGKPAAPLPLPARRRRLTRALIERGDVPLTTVARRVGYSMRALYRQAERVLGETPAAHARRHQLDAAALALLGSRRTVLEIALEQGFRSHETFTRAFRRRFGLTPSAFRCTRASSLPPGFRLALALARRLEGGAAL